MTLAITQQTPRGIISLSDTQLAFADCRKENPYYGALKSHILCPTIVLHFAGDTHWAEVALHRIHENFENLTNEDYENLIDLVLEVHNESQQKTDFIIAESVNNGICKIETGTKLTKCEKAYIGDPEAYSIFSKHLEEALVHQSQTDQKPSKYGYSAALDNAFKSTMQSSEATTVGGLSVSILQNENLFWYQPKLEIDIGPTTMKVGPEPKAIPFGNAHNGSFSVNFLTTERGDSVQALGVHLFTGNIGILWGPVHHLRPLVLINCTHDALVGYAKEVWNAKLVGMKIG